jgi:hypothetical protein
MDVPGAPRTIAGTESDRFGPGSECHLLSHRRSKSQGERPSYDTERSIATHANSESERRGCDTLASRS